jgi:ribosomal protein L4
LRVYNGKKTRAGKGKLRNRRFTHKRGPLVIVDDE